jgi:hypothetical protein
MKKVIKIIKDDNVYYHVSHNPNNGKLTFTKDIEEASVFTSDWDVTFISHIEKQVKEQYPKSKIYVIDVDLIENKKTEFRTKDEILKDIDKYTHKVKWHTDKSNNNKQRANENLVHIEKVKIMHKRNLDSADKKEKLAEYYQEQLKSAEQELKKYNK